MTATEEKLIGILRSGLKLREGLEIGPETVIFGKEGLGLDSVDVLEIAVLLDKHFGVMLEEGEEARGALATIGALAAYLDRRKKT